MLQKAIIQLLSRLTLLIQRLVVALVYFVVVVPQDLDEAQAEL